MHEPEAEAEPWSFLNIDNIFSNNYYGDSSQHDVKICHEQYITDSNYDYIENDEIIARSLLQEELSQLSISEESPKLSHSGEEYLQNSNIVPNWHSSSNDYYFDQEGVQNESDDEASLCSSPEDRSCDGENYYYNLDITDGSELDGEVEKRLYQMIPVPHIPRINGDIPSVDEATSDHQRLLDRLQLYDLIEHKVQGDGNCQFRALSDQFYRTPEHHKLVRQQVVRQLKAHPEIYEGYVPMEYADYLKRMSKSEEWGDHVTLQAAADSYGAKIVIVTSFKDTCYIEILPKDQQSKRVIYLSFWAEVHYNSIYPQGDLPPSDLKRKKKWWNFRNKQ
ncbi:Cysteine proteinases superfamily protein [Striga hermonthica]|uniref:ubiquitinyl hydrolase 1 n=1 Tax=Striga hermonthica TaxID=68872 RepID=A0A9N7NH64_STRHE|nr:Cysteine proteinases superfamily protein [Striga hermonthica]